MPAQRKVQRAGRSGLGDVAFERGAGRGQLFLAAHVADRDPGALRQEEAARGDPLARQSQDDHPQAGIRHGALAPLRQRCAGMLQAITHLPPTTTHAPGHNAWKRSVSVCAHTAATPRSTVQLR